MSSSSVGAADEAATTYETAADVFRGLQEGTMAAALVLSCSWRCGDVGDGGEAVVVMGESVSSS